MFPQKNSSNTPQDDTPLAGTGNASNPSPQASNIEAMSDNQFLGVEAEKYLRESANIEDVPDAQDQQDMDETIKMENE